MCLPCLCTALTGRPFMTETTVGTQMNFLLENVIVALLVRLLPETCFCSPACRLHRVTYVRYCRRHRVDWLTVQDRLTKHEDTVAIRTPKTICQLIQRTIPEYVNLQRHYCCHHHYQQHHPSPVRPR